MWSLSLEPEPTLRSDTPPPPAVRAEDEVDRRLKPGTLLGKDWEILGPLGSGGMSDVFLAFNRRDHRRYALKVLAEKHRDNPSEVARFELEYLALTRVRHESIVVPFVAGCERGVRFYAMELLEGESLDRLYNRERLSPLRAAKIGFVFQSYHLLSEMDVTENVMLPAELNGLADPRQQALEWLTRVGLAGRINHYPRQLSGGEQQRVAIARAFASRPKLLFADEPTGNLDTVTAGAVIDLLFELNRSAGTTLILVTHDHALAERCDRRIELRAGAVVNH